MFLKVLNLVQKTIQDDRLYGACHKFLNMRIDKIKRKCSYSVAWKLSC